MFPNCLYIAKGRARTHPSGWAQMRVPGSRKTRICANGYVVSHQYKCDSQPNRKGAHMKSKLLALGLGGTILAVLCCFTPFLPYILAVLGLSSLLAYVYTDTFLLPILAGFLILTGYALWRLKQK
jgi:mercuric ion transport protein